MTATVLDRGTCAYCPASRDGCEARRAAGFGRCCNRCDHPEHPVFLNTHTASTAADMGHTRPHLKPPKKEEVR